MTIYVCMDDTDNLNSRGTGRLARVVAEEISKKYEVYGVTRHQLYVHPEIPFTSHNSCAVIHVKEGKIKNIKDIFKIARENMLNDFIEGSDPGLAVAHIKQISPSLVAFGKDAKNKILTQEKARELAKNLNIKLEGLGGTEDGVIGAIAGLGLVFTGNDGRFIHKGNIRKLIGPHKAEILLKNGVDAIFTMNGLPVTEGIIFNEQNKSVKPCPVNGKGILYVEEHNGVLKALKRD
ncbi:MAG: ABC transporter substrate-binding protein [Methanomicrobiales archaeon]